MFTAHDRHRAELRDLCSFLATLSIPALAGGALILLVLMLGVDPHSYAQSLALKKDALARTPAPRLIVLGGSGAASSIDAARIARQHDVAPVSMGLYAGLGIRYATRVRTEIASGDIILFAPEYEMLSQRPTGDGSLLLEMLYANPSELPHVATLRGAVVMTRAFPGWLQVHVGRIRDRFTLARGWREATATERLYRLEHISSYGELDVSSVPESIITTEDIIAQGDGFVRPMTDVHRSHIRALIERADAAGAHAYIVMPATPASIAGMNLEPATLLYNDLLELVGEDRVIGTPALFTFPDDWFLDSVGHLTEEGKRARTDLIMQELERLH